MANTIIYKKFRVETYPEVFIDYKNKIENPNYDDTLKVFTVPEAWLIRTLEEEEFTIDWFINQSDWDDSLWVYNKAYEEGVLLEEHVEYR